MQQHARRFFRDLAREAPRGLVTEATPMDTIVELASFLRPDSKPELKSATLEHLAGLTVTRDGREVFTRYPPLLESLSDIVRRLEIPYARDALTCFINLAAEKSSTEELLSANVLNVLLESLSACSDSICKEKLCMTLSNLTRTETGSEAFVQLLRTKGDNCLSDIVDIFCESQNRGSRELDYIATVFGNVSQVADGRDLMMDRSKAILKRLLPLLECSASAICRRSIACLVKNCCFDVQHQEWILSDDIDILSRLLLPLAGPEELEEEEMEKLPIDLQYLGDDKTREPEADIRVMLLEAIMQQSTPFL
ncbi:protein HGH1 homolog isoform X2 [Corticium candelabrum]|uniref:protein HGH1 homolog isoform X2 n=1 Tax=Corticium candelabrum TaxID=121492 RepID=UPI002E269340|nr:protein HGH1 homolog isoform X2 [Corticium candelabrum]